MNTKMALIAIFVSAVITFGLRALPFLVFQEGKELPDQIKRLGMVLPSSIMAVLIVYCLKDVGDDFMADGLWKLIAAAITAVSYKWKHNTLISILLGTVSYRGRKFDQPLWCDQLPNLSVSNIRTSRGRTKHRL